MKRHQAAILVITISLVAACNSTNHLTTKSQKQMFTAEQITATLSKVRTGADFPHVAMKLKNLGITHYETRMEDGQSTFYGAGNYKVHTGANYAPIVVADKVNSRQLESDIRKHQQGKSDYFQISRQSADDGIAQWEVDLEKMTCSYINKTGKPVWVEQIPTAGYEQVPFTIEQIKATHSKVKSGADFPAYIQEMNALGVTAYEHYVSDGQIRYHGENDFMLSANAKWPPVEVAKTGNETALRRALSIHQKGQTDYLTLWDPLESTCRHASLSIL